MTRSGCIYLSLFIQAALLLMVVTVSQAQNYTCYSCNSTIDANCGMQGFTNVGISQVTSGYYGCVTSTKYNTSTKTYETVTRGCALVFEQDGCYFDPSSMGLYTCRNVCKENNCNGAQPLQNVTCYSCRNCGPVNNSTATLTCPYSCLVSTVSQSSTGIILQNERSCGAFPVYGTKICNIPFTSDTTTCVQQCSTEYCNADIPKPPTQVVNTGSSSTPTTTKRPLVTTASSAVSNFRFYGEISSYLSVSLFLWSFLSYV